MNAAALQRFNVLACKNDKPEDLWNKVNLLLYGHLYVVALLICAFVLMGKTYINKLMQECDLTKVNFWYPEHRLP